MLGSQQLSLEDRDTVRQIQRSGSLLLSLVNDVLDMSRIESGELSLSLVPFVPRTVCEEVVDIFSSSASDRGVALVLEVEPIDRTLIGDEHRLRQVLFNLVGNALKFTAEGSVTIVLRAEPDGARHCQLTLSVIDTGIGIPLTARERIFAAFAQAEAGLDRTYGGSGLGLAISARLMSLMGGTLSLDWSEPGEGSRFVATVRLPVAADVAADSEEPATIGCGSFDVT